MNGASNASRVFQTNRLAGVLCAVGLGALGVLWGVKGLTTATLLDHPEEITWGASASAYLANRVKQGGVLYGDWRQRPHVVAWYGPALYLPVAYLGRWTGADIHGLFMIGRWISLLATLGTGGLILWILRARWEAPLALAGMMALIFLTADDIFWRFDMTFRPDAPACFLTMLGLVLLVRSDRPLTLYGSVFVFLLAFLYKQSVVSGPVAAAIWLALSGHRHRALAYALVSAVVFLGSVGLLGVWTGGLYFLNVIDGLKGNATFRNVPHLLSQAAETAVIPMGMALGVIVLEWFHRKWSVDTMLFAVSSVVALVTTYRDGPGPYYYMVPLAVGCVLCGRQLGSWWRERSVVSATGIALVVVLAMLSVRYVPRSILRLVELPGHWRSFCQRQETHRQRAEALRNLVNYLKGLPGPVLSQFNEVTLYCPNSILIDTLTLTSMADVGAFDDRPLIEEIRRGKVAAIVLNPRRAPAYQSTDQFSRRWLRAMGQTYRQVQIPGLEWAQIYRPIETTAPEITDLPKPPG